MRILLAHKFMFRGGGTATYLFALWEELEKRGHEIIPFTVAYEQTVPTQYSQFFVSPPAGKNQTHLKDMRLSPWTAARLMGRAIWSFEAYRKALALVDAAKPDVAYVHNLYSYMSPSPIAAFKRRGVPVVMRVPDTNLVCPGVKAIRDGRACLECMDRGLMWSFRFKCHKGSLVSTAARVLSMAVHRWMGIYRAVDFFVTPSKFMRKILIKAGVPEDRVVHLPSFYPAASSGSHKHRTDPTYVLYFGRVSPEKGLDVLVRAAQWLPPGVQVWIAGDDRDGERKRLESIAEKLQVGNVRFLGHQGPQALHKLIAESIFTVIPSRWYDNCPMAVLESFAYGKPVVGANIGGIPEQIENGCGLLFEPGDSADLAAKLNYLLTHSEERLEMGRAALRRLETIYSPEAHCRNLLRLFESLTRGGGTSEKAVVAVR
jgi:glycosyltransferase involved in cell wall biosynthesis